MKLLHTSDWHLGKSLAGYSLLEDQIFVLEKLRELLISEQIDVLLVAGDIYDKTVPSVESVRLLDNILYDISTQTQTHLLAVAGNHDNPTRLAFGSRLYQSSRIHIIGELQSKLAKITLKDEHGPVNFYFLPYFTLEKASALFDMKFFNINAAFAKIIEYNRPEIKAKERNVLIAHGFFSYWEKDKEAFSDVVITESELPIGGLEVMDISVANFFDYVALGHLHAPQKLVCKQINYSGSLLKYSISEANQRKGILEVELKEKGNLSVRTRQLPVKRDLKVVTGYMEEILRHPKKFDAQPEDYVFVKLLDCDSVFDGITRLRQVFENVIGLSLPEYDKETLPEGIALESESNLLELFEKFHLQLTGESLDESKAQILKEVIKELEE